MRSPYRLPADAPHGFGGTLLDRNRPIRFRLDGRPIDGFVGDTVLSAALASGMDCAGRLGDSPLALTEAFAPLVTVGRGSGAAATRLPMDRVPALDGLDYASAPPDGATTGLGGAVGRLFGRFGRISSELPLRFNAGVAMGAPWLGRPPEADLEADLVVIGAGLAGLAAAGAAAALGRRVVLVERRAAPGGAVHFFGSIDGEDGPDLLLERLVAGLSGKFAVQLLTSTEAFQIEGGAVHAHQVLSEGGRVASRVLRILAPRIIIATGATERLPVFSGNRLPGVSGAYAAFRLAREHGVWLGDSAIVSTPVSAAYRLALYAADAGVSIQRIVDTRVGLHSRFIDFCKARGVTLGSGLAVAAVTPPAGRDTALKVDFAPTSGDGAPQGTAQQAGLLVVGGGWQPALGLWLAAGGRAGWDPAGRRIAAEGERDGIRLAGSAAGWLSNSAAIASGRTAALDLFGKPAPAVVEKIIPPQYETPDAPTPVIRPQATASPPALLDHGHALAAIGPKGTDLAMPGPARLALGDLAALVAAGMVEAAEVGEFAAERCVARSDIRDAAWPEAPASAAQPSAVPAYLAGRFGAEPVICRLSAPDARAFSIGSLVFATDRVADPLAAVGVVLAAPAAGESGGTALIANPPQTPETLLFVNETGAPSPARVMERQPVESRPARGRGRR